MAALLCSHGADLDLQCQMTLTRSDGGKYFLKPIEGALMKGHADIVKYLVGRGAIVDLEEWKKVPDLWENLVGSESLYEWITQNVR